MREKLIETWEKTGFFISLMVLIVSSYLELNQFEIVKDYPVIVGIVLSLTSGFVATIIILYAERWHRRRELEKEFLRYNGTYKRIDIGRDNASQAENDMIRGNNNELEIEMTYLGGHAFSIIINYWREVNAKAKGFVEFNPVDKKSGSGNYRYFEGEGYIGEFNHYGKLELSWDESKGEMIVLYHHQHPRDIPFNPDNNRGWEIWKKLPSPSKV